MTDDRRQLEAIRAMVTKWETLDEWTQATLAEVYMRRVRRALDGDPDRHGGAVLEVPNVGMVVVFEGGPFAGRTMRVPDEWTARLHLPTGYLDQAVYDVVIADGRPATDDHCRVRFAFNRVC